MITIDQIVTTDLVIGLIQTQTQTITDLLRLLLDIEEDDLLDSELDWTENNLYLF